ncbi:teichoic acids export ABC transporter ATP-binding subunit TagH [Alkalicoccobacillus plakortidis]|uniref:Teichoic acids export ABC transporter ATP-binding subunit TagH n=1 Tax=Alkalicoccobacillus plakortidis TaxID=444060 RepID=A0ABT0XIK8_9BACI|nr:teichoic acids export ABC transporter ATP-binding subunit TagH [Alkalicoccobacillus plakortidis]MCM2675741.1 teichoic acids export ABC transporter ATP-binding subunit TagH [Alkalicoccobacillus plakortidis]
MQHKVKLTGVSKQYTLYRTNTEKLLDILTPKSMKKEKQRNFYALRDISLEIKDGETVGVVGINGSGKSTISNILSHVIPPTEGQIDINGEPSLIAINVGLNNNLSGYDNIELKLLMHGFSRNEVDQLTPSIEDFADIGDFMNQPVKKYSSGMKSRLGFAISVHTNPDLLIVDEALSVGDKTFYQKCLDKINEFKSQGKTIIFISHSIGQIKSISDRVLWLHNGELKEFGETKTVLENYEEYINWFNKLSNEAKQAHKEELKDKRSTIVAPNHQEKKVIEPEEKPYDPDILPSRYTQKKKKVRVKSKKQLNLAFPLQLSIFVLAFIISGIFLVSPTIGTSVSEGNEEDNADLVEQEEIEQESLFNEDKEGYISVEEAALYQDAHLNIEDTVLPFASKVTIIGEMQNLMLI